jgi:hypothetical protein
VAQLLEESSSVHFGHLHIRDRDVEGSIAPRNLQGLNSARRAGDITSGLEPVGQQE